MQVSMVYRYTRQVTAYRNSKSSVENLQSEDFFPAQGRFWRRNCHGHCSPSVVAREDHPIDWSAMLSNRATGRFGRMVLGDRGGARALSMLLDQYGFCGTRQGWAIID